MASRPRALPLPRPSLRHVRPLPSSATWPSPPRHPVPWWTVVSAALSPVLATGGWIVAGAVQPASYSPVGTTISVMAGHAGTDRWIMTGALMLVGGCQLVTAAGLTGVRLPARVLLVVAGLSSIGIAVSPEPAHGSTPQHLAWTALGAVIITIWPAFTARRAPQTPLILSPAGSAAVTAVFAALLGWLIFETQGGGDLGLAERLVSGVQISWPFILAVVLRRSAARPGWLGAPGGPRPQEVTPGGAAPPEAPGS